MIHFQYNWTTAEQMCKNRGMNLISILTKEDEHILHDFINKKHSEFDIFLKILKKYDDKFYRFFHFTAVLKYTVDCDYIWTGGYRERRGGKWLWNNGKSFKYTNWLPSEPIDISDQNCISLTRNMQWYDYPCENENCYICEKI